MPEGWCAVRRAVCHTEKQFFLAKENLPEDGSKANLELLYEPKALKK